MFDAHPAASDSVRRFSPAFLSFLIVLLFFIILDIYQLEAVKQLSKLCGCRAVVLLCGSSRPGGWSASNIGGGLWPL
jgi:hypothetical protein